MKTRWDYNEEFKQTIVNLYKSGCAVTKLSRDYNVTTQTIYGWIAKFSPIIASDKEEIAFKDYQEIKKQKEELEAENESLRKAIIALAQVSRH